MRFATVGQSIGYTVYVDGNRNGVRSRDVQRGVDREIQGGATALRRVSGSRLRRAARPAAGGPVRSGPWPRPDPVRLEPHGHVYGPRHVDARKLVHSRPWQRAIRHSRLRRGRKTRACSSSILAPRKGSRYEQSSWGLVRRHARSAADAPAPASRTLADSIEGFDERPFGRDHDERRLLATGGRGSRSVPCADLAVESYWVSFLTCSGFGSW